MHKFGRFGLSGRMFHVWQVCRICRRTFYPIWFGVKHLVSNTELTDCRRSRLRGNGGIQ